MGSALFLAYRQLPLAVCSHGKEKPFSLSSSSCKGTNPIMGTPPSAPHLTLITSQRPHLQTPSHWALGLQHMNLGGDTNTQSIRTTRFVMFCYISPRKLMQTPNNKTIHDSNKRPESFSVNGQIINISGFVGHMVSVATAQLCHHAKLAIGTR